GSRASWRTSRSSGASPWTRLWRPRRDCPCSTRRSAWARRRTTTGTPALGGSDSGGGRTPGWTGRRDPRGSGGASDRVGAELVRPAALTQLGHDLTPYLAG